MKTHLPHTFMERDYSWKIRKWYFVWQQLCVVFVFPAKFRTSIAESLSSRYIYSVVVKSWVQILPLWSQSTHWLWYWFFVVVGHLSCGILVPWLEIEPWPSVVNLQSPNHWTTREFPSCVILLQLSFITGSLFLQLWQWYKILWVCCGD